MQEFKSQGFTRFETITIYLLITVFVFLAIKLIDPIYQIQKMKDTKRKEDLTKVQVALEVYYKAFGRYPDYSKEPPYRIVAQNSKAAEWGTDWLPYLREIPKDFSPDQYVYYSRNGQSYYLYANLEAGDKDSQSCKGGKPCDSLKLNAVPQDACGGVCNYAVTSSNVTP